MGKRHRATLREESKQRSLAAIEAVADRQAEHIADLKAELDNHKCPTVHNVLDKQRIAELEAENKRLCTDYVHLSREQYATLKRELAEARSKVKRIKKGGRQLRKMLEDFDFPETEYQSCIYRICPWCGVDLSRPSADPARSINEHAATCSWAEMFGKERK